MESVFYLSIIIIYMYIYYIYLYYYYTRVECLSTPCYLPRDIIFSTYGDEGQHSTTQPTQPNDFIG